MQPQILQVTAASDKPACAVLESRPTSEYRFSKPSPEPARQRGRPQVGSGAFPSAFASACRLATG